MTQTYRWVFKTGSEEFAKSSVPGLASPTPSALANSEFSFPGKALSFVPVLITFLVSD